VTYLGAAPDQTWSMLSSFAHYLGVLQPGGVMATVWLAIQDVAGSTSGHSTSATNML